MNQSMKRLRDAIARIEAANELCPLETELSDRELLHLVELVTDSTMETDRIAVMFDRMNHGEVVFTLKHE